MILTAGNAAQVSVTLKVDSKPVRLNETDVVTACLYSQDGAVPLGSAKTLSPETTGSDWGAGRIVALFTAEDTRPISEPAVVVRFTVTSSGQTRYWSVSLSAEASGTKRRTALFSSPSLAVSELRRDFLMLSASDFLSDNRVSDEYLWDSLVGAEAEASRALRAFFEPTVVLPETAGQAEIDALKSSGKQFVTEASYDYDPQGWNSNSWGYMLLRRTPVVRVDSVHFTYPNPSSDVLNVPQEWLRLDKKYGHLRFVPTGTMMALGPMSTYIMTAISSGRVIPGMIQVRYVAGLENAAQTYPDLIKLVKRMAILSILKNAFLPQSGSISADGLSRSTSVDTDKWQDGIEHDLAALRDSIHGVRMGVL